MTASLVFITLLKLFLPNVWNLKEMTRKAEERLLAKRNEGKGGKAEQHREWVCSQYIYALNISKNVKPGKEGRTRWVVGSASDQSMLYACTNVPG